ncbi:hypothetical protein [Nonomuraea coxensis]|nr:hypothetical protein [Nonomuraea coxensis]
MRAAIWTGAVAALLIGQVAVALPALADQIPPPWKHRTSLRVVPDDPQQNDFVRVFVHCPSPAEHATLTSTAFMLRSSWRPYREVGISLSNRGLGRKTVGISYFTPPGDYEVVLRCVQDKIDKKTRLKKLKLISWYVVPITVRPFRVAHFFD